MGSVLPATYQYVVVLVQKSREYLTSPRIHSARDAQDEDWTLGLDQHSITNIQGGSELGPASRV